MVTNIKFTLITMKKIKTLLMASMAILALSCSQEDTLNPEQDANADLSAPLSIMEQSALAKFDYDKKGLYHGLFLAGYGQERGQIWINMANNGKYSAEVVMQDGRRFIYKAVKSEVKSEKSKTFFVSESGSSFYLDANNYQQPEITEAKIGGDLFFGVVKKKTSFADPISLTGTFEETGNPAHSGTWNFIADGTLVDPNNNGNDEHIGLTDVIVTKDGSIFMDQGPFETSSCFGPLVPLLNAELTTSNPFIQVVMGEQTSEFFPSATTTWSIIGITTEVSVSYTTDCVTSKLGRFNHVWGPNDRTGTVEIDLLPPPPPPVQ